MSGRRAAWARLSAGGALALVLVLASDGCRSKGETDLREEDQGTEATNMTATLETLLQNEDWAAVPEAERLGAAAVPALQAQAASESYRSRQIAVTCAGKLREEPGAAEILGQGLSDPNVNVRLAAANALSVEPPAPAAGPLLQALSTSSEAPVREALALGAGYLPGERTLEVLREVAGGSDPAAENARAALARLGDPAARTEILEKLRSDVPRERYDAVGWLRYIGDASLVDHAERLLGDPEPAMMIGSKRAPRFRRVCDEAADTVIYLKGLDVPFDHGPERIYTDQELARVRQG